MPSEHKILIFDKADTNHVSNKGKRAIYNVKLIVESLRLKYPWLSVASSNFKIPFKEQAVLLKDVTIFITPYGGGGFGAIFLPPDATVITIDLPPGGFRRSQGDRLEYHYFWNYVSYLNFFRYRIESADELLFHGDQRSIDEANRDFRKASSCAAKKRWCLYNANIERADYVIRMEKLFALVNLSFSR